MKTRFILIAAISLATLGMTACSADVADDDGTTEDALNSSKQRVTFEGVSVGFGDKASKIISKLNAKGIDADTVEVVGYGPAVTAEGSDGLKLKALAAGGTIGFSIVVEGDDYRLDIRADSKTEVLRNGRVNVPRDAASALANNAMKFGRVSIELGTSIQSAAQAMGTSAREQNNYGTTELIFDFQHGGDPVGVTAGTDGKIRAIEIVHTETTGSRSRPIITTTHFTNNGGVTVFNRVNDRAHKEETYSSNGNNSVSISTSFN